MTFNSSYRFLALCVLVVIVVKVAAQDFNIEENIKDLLARRKNMEFMRQLIEDMDNQLTRLHKRSCYLRLPGMDCDYGDIAGNIKDQSMWGHEDSPGKKRRSNICYKMGNPEGCLGKVIDDNKKDTSHWGNPDSPGKK